MRTGLALPGSHTLLFRQALPALLAMVRRFAGADLESVRDCSGEQAGRTW